MDLRVFRGWAAPCADQQFVFNFRIYNWETVAVGANLYTVEIYFNDAIMVTTGSCGTLEAFNAGGTSAGTVGSSCAFTSISACNSGPSNAANQKATITLGAINIPPNGGYVQFQSVQSFNRTGWPAGAFDSACDDYSKPGAQAWHDDQYWALFETGTLVCEYSNASTQDPLSGQPACTGASACSPAGTNTVSPTRSPTYTISPSPTRTPTPSASPTPCGTSPRLDLEVTEQWNHTTCGDGQNPLRFRITNWDTVAYNAANLTVSLWVYDDLQNEPYSWNAIGAVNLFSSGGAGAGSTTASGNIGTVFTPTCNPGTRQANRRLTLTLAGGSIPANGGYAQFDATWIRNWATSDLNCNDWTRDPGSSGTWYDDWSYALFFGGDSCIVCEHNSPTALDPNTGLNPCGGAGVCAVPFTPTATPSATMTPTPLSCSTPQCSTAWITYGDAYQIPGGVHLTSAAGFQNATAWSNFKLDFGTSFSIQYDMLFSQLGVPNDGGADGIAVIFHNDARGLSAIGDPGQGMGYAEAVGPNAPVSPSIAIEIDTFQNVGAAGDLNWNDPANDHISIHRNGIGDENDAVNSPGAPVDALVGGGNIEDGAYHRVRIDWNDATNTFSVYFDGVLRLNYTEDVVATLFGGQTCVYWGFGSATGGSVNVHEVLEIACSSPTPTPTNTPVFGTPTRTPTATRTPTPACNASLYNGDMEAAAGGGPFTDPTAYYNWFYYFDACTSGSWTTAQSRSATHSLHVQSTGCGAGQGGYWVQNICGVDVNCDYQFCAWVRSNTSSATSGIFISIEQRTAAGGSAAPAITDYNISNANGVWVQHCVTITSFAGGFDHLRLVMGNEGEADQAWFDDATLTTVGACGTPTSTWTPTRTPTRTPTWTPTYTRTPTYTPTRTRTATPSVSPSFSPTRSNTPGPSPTPAMPLVKSANVTQATIGQMITYCIAWTNNASSATTINIWDTVSSFITYVGCDSSCTQSGGLVQWSVNAAAGANGSVCFWGTVNGYPLLPGWPGEIRTASLAGAERRRQLFFPVEPWL